MTNFSDKLTQLVSVSSDGQSIIFERWTDPDLDVGSDLWVMNADGSNPHLFLQDAARPSWFGPGGNPLAMAPLVTIDMDPIGIYVNWDDLEINVGGYKVRYSEKPYFQVGDAGVTTIDLEPGTEGWVHHDAAGDPAHNYYYFVQGVGAGARDVRAEQPDGRLQLWVDAWVVARRCFSFPDCGPAMAHLGPLTVRWQI